MNLDKIRDKMYLSGFSAYLGIAGLVGVMYGVGSVLSEKRDVADWAILGSSTALLLAGTGLRLSDKRRYESYTQEDVENFRNLYKNIDKLKKEGRLIGDSSDVGAVVIVPKKDINTLEKKL